MLLKLDFYWNHIILHYFYFSFFLLRLPGLLCAFLFLLLLLANYYFQDLHTSYEFKCDLVKCE